HPGDEVGPRRKEKVELGDRLQRIGRIQQQGPDLLGYRRATRFSDHDRTMAGAGQLPGETGGQGGLSRALRPFDCDIERGRHPRVMMLLCAPFSIPWAISWFTFTITFSKLARATT